MTEPLRPERDVNTLVQALIRERLARDPQRLARILDDAEAAAWAEVTEAIKSAMKAAILAQVSASGSTLASVMPVRSEDTGRAAEAAFTANGATPGMPEVEPPTVELRMVEPPQVQAEETAAALPSVDPDHEQRSDGTGLYVYGVIERRNLALPDLEGVAAGTVVRLYEYGMLAALVSDVPLNEFGQAGLEAHLSDLTWLEQCVRRHQAVLDQVLSITALAPMKFATIYLTEQGMRTWLAQQEENLLTVLAHLRNRQEWGLKVFVDRTVLAEHVAEYSDTLRDLRAQMAGKSQGAAYFLVRRIQELTAEEVERVSFSVADDVHRTLAQQSVAAQLNSLPSEDVEPNVVMVLNAAYLIADEQVTVVQAAVDALDEEHRLNGFRFQLSGPWPAYNFVAASFAGEDELDAD